MNGFDIARLKREIRHYLGMEPAQLQFDFRELEGLT